MNLSLTGCFNLLSGYPGCRQAEKTLVLLWKLNGEHYYLVVMFVAIVVTDNCYKYVHDVCSNCP